MAAGKALSAASEVARSRPGVGKTVRKSAATAARPPHDRPGADRDPAEPDAHEGGGLLVLGGGPHGDPPGGVPEGEQEGGDEEGRGEQGGDPGLRDGDPADGDDGVAPGVAEGEDVGADPAGQLGGEEDVDADGDDGEDAVVGAPVTAHHEELDGRADHRRARDAREQSRPEADLVVEDGGDVASRPGGGGVGEVDDLGGAEDDHETEGDEGVDRAQ